MAELMIQIQDVNCMLIMQDELDKQNMALLGIKDNGQPNQLEKAEEGVGQ